MSSPAPRPLPPRSPRRRAGGVSAAWLVLAALAAWAWTGGARAACSPPASATPVLIGYFPSWGIYARGFQVQDIDADRLTHVYYAFANIDGTTGEVVLGDSWADVDIAHPGDCFDPGCLRGSFHQLELLKQRHPHLKVLISIGGWTWSQHFSDVAATAAGRQRFAQSAVNLFILGRFGGSFGDHPGIFDGIDVDWEHPVVGGLWPGRPEDRANYTLLLAELRSQLDAAAAVLGRPLELSVAVGAGPSQLSGLDLPGIAASVDRVCLMSYDYHGAWDAVTNFNAPLATSSADPGPAPSQMNLQGSVQGALAAGCPARQLVAGLAFYGRTWTGVAAANDGLYQPASGAGAGTFEAGSVDYWDVAARLVPSMTRHWHDEARVPWLFDGTTFVSYDDPQSIAEKAAYIASEGLQGAMAWELSGDLHGVPAPAGSLLAALNENLCPPPAPVPAAIRDLRMSREGSDLLFSWTLDPDAAGGYHVYTADDASLAAGLRDTLPGVDPILSASATPSLPERLAGGVATGLRFYQVLGLAADGVTEGPN